MNITPQMQEYYRVLVNRAKAAGDPFPDQFAAQIFQESRFNAAAVGPNTRHGQALGIAQILPSTGKRYGLSATDLMDPEKAIDAAIKYRRDIASYLVKNGIQPTSDNILAGYNAGEGRVKQYKGVPPFHETMHYVKRINHDIPTLFGQGASGATGTTPPVAGTGSYHPLLPPTGNPETVTESTSFSPWKPTEYKGIPGLSNHAIPNSADLARNIRNGILGEVYGGKSA